MPKIYKRECDYCKRYYIGRGKYCCGNRCHSKSDRSGVFKKGHIGIVNSVGKKGRSGVYQRESYMGTGKYTRTPDMIGENHWNWKGGISKLLYPLRYLYPQEWNSELKRKIMERDEFKCYHCGFNRDLIVHHIDQDKLNCKENNLLTLCRSCHTKLHHNLTLKKSKYPLLNLLEISESRLTIKTENFSAVAY